MASGQIYIPPETYVIGEIITRWPRWRRLTWREKVWMVCAYFDRHDHRDDFEIDSFTPFAREVEALPEHQQMLTVLFDELYRFMARSHGFTEARWGDKTPWNTMHLKDIVKLYPDAYFLYLKRHGLDVVASQMKADMRDFAGSAERWIAANNACLRYLRRAQRAPLTISYEDLVSTPEPIFREIFAWAGLDFAPEHLTQVPEKLADVGRHEHHAAVTRPITPSSIGKWKTSLTADDLEALPEGFNTMMDRLGYAQERPRVE